MVAITTGSGYWTEMVNEKYIFDIASKETPNVEVVGKKGWLRHDVASALKGSQNVGIELGVARGIYSKRMVESGKFKRFYGVDSYSDIHNTEEYITALKHIGIENSTFTLLRMDFESALAMFDDQYFDFIYVDGFAHTGEEGGKTLVDWFRKLKVGGILAGDDYHHDWPLVTWAVNDLARKLDVAVHVTLGTESEIYCKYPTWFISKDSVHADIAVNPLLYRLGMQEKKRIQKKRAGMAYRVRPFAKKLLVSLGLKNDA